MAGGGDVAQRLLVERQDRSIVPSLIELAQTASRQKLAACDLDSRQVWAV